ncbi:MAG: Hsp20/alpha crystallin family protein [Eubacteriaceae bacterium]|jgi:HSP20 family protein
MYMVPRDRFGISVFDDLFNDSFFGNEPRVPAMMKTDIAEKGDNMQLDMELPGYDKSDITVDLDKGYLTITADKTENNEKKEDGKIVSQERFTGHCSRSFYVGDDLNPDQIKASFDKGVLQISFPKEEKREIPEKKTVAIAGPEEKPAE